MQVVSQVFVDMRGCLYSRIFVRVAILQYFNFAPECGLHILTPVVESIKVVYFVRKQVFAKLFECEVGSPCPFVPMGKSRIDVLYQIVGRNDFHIGHRSRVQRKRQMGLSPLPASLSPPTASVLSWCSVQSLKHYNNGTQNCRQTSNVPACSG